MLPLATVSFTCRPGSIRKENNTFRVSLIHKTKNSHKYPDSGNSCLLDLSRKYAPLYCTWKSYRKTLLFKAIYCIPLITNETNYALPGNMCDV